MEANGGTIRAGKNAGTHHSEKSTPSILFLFSKILFTKTKVSFIITKDGFRFT
jgi:hypothetical protein